MIPSAPRARLTVGLLVLLWAASLGSMGAAFVAGDQATAPGFLLGAAYLVVLVAYLARSGPSPAALPALSASAAPGLGFRGMLLAIVGAIALFFALGVALQPGATLIVLSALVALGIAAAWRDAVTPRLAWTGLGAGLVCGLGTMLLGPGDLWMALLYTFCVPALFVGGGVLVEQTGLSRVRLLEGRSGRGLQSLLWGCVAALPPALLNLLAGAGAGDAAVDRWWEPFFAIVPGLAEETWARLFLTTLFYALLRPRTNDRPQRAVVAAILLAALTHSLAHFPDLNLLSVAFVALLYGVPMGVLFVQRDLERAVGYHLFIDLIRFTAAWLS